MNGLSHILIALLLVSAAPAASHQSDSSTLRIMFYNVENLFDIYDDPLTNDEEFTPNGDKKWTAFRYNKKLIDLSKVIMAAGGWQPPDVIGLCEVENARVLLDLISKTPLKSWNYQIIHENSPDARGIDVALLYRSDRFQKVRHHIIGMHTEAGWRTRDILEATMHTASNDTIHFYVNHWPSRAGGRERSESRRIFVAQRLRHHIDSVFAHTYQPKIIIMGDFNDEATDKSLKDGLKARNPEEQISPECLYNLSYYDHKKGLGTLVYKEINHQWFLFDQFIVSGVLLEGGALRVQGEKSMIFNQPWLMRNERPHRTYQGPIYSGGFSDHFPIFIDLYLKP